MATRSSCKYKNTCAHSLVARFMAVARWGALALLLGIGFADVILHLSRGDAVNWVFCGICVVSGVILFWMGQCLLESECGTRKKAGSCHALRMNTSLGQPVSWSKNGVKSG